MATSGRDFRLDRHAKPHFAFLMFVLLMLTVDRMATEHSQ